jgi:hypothetical protein
MMQKLACGLLLVLAGCATQGALPPGMATVRAEPRAADLPLARGETRLVVRTVDAAAPGTEIPGASCRAESRYFTADFASPAVLLFADYGASAPTVSVTCQSGTRSGTAVSAPEAVWNRGAGGWPAVGISVGTGSNNGVGVGMGWYGGGAGASTGEPVVRYPDVRVPLE